MKSWVSRLENGIKARKVRVGVIGLGYVGLPLVKILLKRGFSVTGFDTDPQKVSLLNRGRSYIRHIPAGELKKSLAAKKFKATGDFRLLRATHVILICVPTPLDSHRNPDLSFVLMTAVSIAENLRRGQLVVLESTTYPGTTDGEVLPILEASGLKGGKDFFLGYSPEREDPGNKFFTAETTPKIVGGLTRDCLRVTKAFYDELVVRTVPVSSTRAAESAKLLENIFRSVNIALVNELKMIFERLGVDVWEVIKASSTKPFGFMPFQPGPGLGGHCIPIDPFYLTWKAREVDFQTRFIELAGEINSFMPYYVVEKTVTALNGRKKPVKGARVLVLGLAYKKDIDDPRESPSLKIISLLRNKGAKVVYNDPYIPRSTGHRDYPGMDLRSVPLTAALLKKMDAVIISTNHSAYDTGWIVRNSRLVVDTRNAIRGKSRKVVKA